MYAFLGSGGKFNLPNPQVSPWCLRLQRLIFRQLLAFGAVFAARTTRRGEDGKYLHVAVKFTPLRSAMGQAGGIIRHDELGLISNEVLAMALLRDNPGVPEVYALYAHGCTLIYVMELCGVWPDTDELEDLPAFAFEGDAHKLVRLKACDGNELVGPHRYFPRYRRAGEIDVCKMLTMHLSTLQSMKDRGCSHDDIAHRNVIANEKYDVCYPALFSPPSSSV